MPTMTRDELSERIQDLKHLDHPRCSIARLGATMDPAESWAGLIEQDIYARLIDDYLKQFAVPVEGELGSSWNECPACGAAGSFSWGIAHGSGSCSCGWPGTLYHYYIHDRRDDPALICSATVNGHRVCEATRGEHIPKEQHWHSQDGSSGIRMILRCPAPVVPPGLRAEYFTADYRPPKIISFVRLLWAHPYSVHLRTRP